MSYLLDTCVLSELAAKLPNPAVATYVDTLPEEQVYLSVITIGEIVKGIEKLPASPRQSALQNWLEQDLLVRFQGKILPLDVDVLTERGRLAARLDRAGKPMPTMDALISATALNFELTLVTHNVADFREAGIEIANPWAAD